MSILLERFGLKVNPFEPSASGVPVLGDLWLPDNWRNHIQGLLDSLRQSRGVKVLALAGEYGSGKTYVLQWLCREEFPKRLGIRPFYFDNPGVQFYDLANSLLRQIGRKDFAKSIWELASIYVQGYQRNLFSKGFEEYLQAQRSKQQQGAILIELQSAIEKAGITSDGEIAHRLARIVADTATKPYFEYRDFIAGNRDTLVAEREEAPYFGAILKTLRLAAGIDAVAFVVDEFEEISLQKRLTRRGAHDYLATLKRLINLTQGEDLWVVVSMTPQAIDQTKMMEPALWERFTGQGQYQFQIPPLEKGEAADLVKRRLNAARLVGFTPPSELFPFPDEFVETLTPAIYSNPRRLVKVCFYAIGDARDIPVPFAYDYLRNIENKAYPADQEGK